MERQRPTPPGYFESFNGAKNREFEHDRDLYDYQEKLKLNPLHNTTLGQMANITNLPARDIADPSQFQDRTIPGYQSDVPSIRYVPTMNDTPQLRPPVTTQDVTQLRTASGGPSGVGRFETGAGPYVPEHTIREVNENAPSSLYQQMAGSQGLERLGKYPPIQANANVTLYQAKLADQADYLMRANPDMSPEQAHAEAAARLYGGTSQERQAKLEETQARSGYIQAGTDMMGRKQDEIESQNAWQRRHGDTQDTLAERRLNESTQRGQQSDVLGWARLNSKREYEDNLFRLFGDKNASGRYSSEEQEALHIGSPLLEKMQTQELNPQEMTVWQGVKQILGIPEPPAYKFTPRPRVGPTGATSPTVPTATGAFQSPPAPSSVAPFDDKEKEKRYQEFKAKHK